MNKIKGKNTTKRVYFAAKELIEQVANLLVILSFVLQAIKDARSEHGIEKGLDLTPVVKHLSLREVDRVFFVNNYLRCDIEDNKFFVSESGFAQLLNAGCETVKELRITWKFNDIDFESDILCGKPALAESHKEVSPNCVVAGGKFAQLEVPMQFELLLPPANRRSISGEVEVTGEDLHGNDFRAEYFFDGKIAEENGKRILFVQIEEKFRLNVREAIERRLFDIE